MSVSAVNTIPSSGAQVLALTPPPGVGPDREVLERSFDFSEFPKLEEVNFSHLISEMSLGLLWIPMVLSTLSPTTSPHLTSLQLTFLGSPSDLPPTFFEDLGDDPQRIADQVIRIEREFEGAVKSMVIRDPKFESVLEIQFPVCVRFTPASARPFFHLYCTGPPVTTADELQTGWVASPNGRPAALGHSVTPAGWPPRHWPLDSDASCTCGRYCVIHCKLHPVCAEKICEHSIRWRQGDSLNRITTLLLCNPAHTITTFSYYLSYRYSID